MTLRSDAARWGTLAKFFHWTIALLIVGAGIVGLYMTGLPNAPQKIRIYAIHKSVGLTVLALALLRLAWRLYDRRPDEVPMPRWQAVGARMVHGLLYLLIFALPLSGWLYNSASGYPLQWWGLVQLPSLSGGSDATLKPLAHGLHEWLFWILVATLVAHAGAALVHHFVERDATLARMLPWRLKRLAAPTATAPEQMPIPAPAEPAVSEPAVSEPAPSETKEE